MNGGGLVINIEAITKALVDKHSLRFGSSRFVRKGKDRNSNSKHILFKREDVDNFRERNVLINMIMHI